VAVLVAVRVAVLVAVEWRSQSVLQYAWRFSLLYASRFEWRCESAMGRAAAEIELECAAAQRSRHQHAVHRSKLRLYTNVFGIPAAKLIPVGQVGVNASKTPRLVPTTIEVTGADGHKLDRLQR